MELIRLCATNDRNGNPRRVYVMISDGAAIAAWDEGYSGSDAVPGIWRQNAYNAPSFAVTPAEYRECLRDLPSPAYAYDVKGYAHLRHAA